MVHFMLNLNETKNNKIVPREYAGSNPVVCVYLSHVVNRVRPVYPSDVLFIPDIYSYFCYTSVLFMYIIRVIVNNLLCNK